MKELINSLINTYNYTHNILMKKLINSIINTYNYTHNIPYTPSHQSRLYSQ